MDSHNFLISCDTDMKLGTLEYSGLGFQNLQSGDSSVTW